MAILRGSYLKQNIGDNVDIFFKININLPQLLYFVVLAAVNGEYWRF